MRSPRGYFASPATDRPSHQVPLARSHRFTASQPRPANPPSRPKSHRCNSGRVQPSPLTKPPLKAASNRNAKPTITTRSSKIVARTTTKQPSVPYRSARRQPSVASQVIKAITGATLQKGKQATGKRIVQLLARLTQQGGKTRAIQRARSREQKAKGVNAKKGKVAIAREVYSRKVLTSSLPSRPKPMPGKGYTHAIETYTTAKRKTQLAKPPISYRSASLKQVARPNQKQTHTKRFKGKTMHIIPSKHNQFTPLPKPHLAVNHLTRRPKPLDSPELTPVPDEYTDSRTQQLKARYSPATRYKAAEPIEDSRIPPFSEHTEDDASDKVAARLDLAKEEEMQQLEVISRQFPRGQRVENGLVELRRNLEDRYAVLSSVFQGGHTDQSSLQGTSDEGISADAVENQHTEVCEMLAEGILEQLTWEAIHLPVMQNTVGAIGSWVTGSIYEQLLKEVFSQKAVISCFKKPLVRFSPISPKST